MASSNLEEIYKQHIKPLSSTERLTLIAMTARDLVGSSTQPSDGPKRSIMELHGLGKEIWGGVDAQDYVDSLRREWDNRPSL